MCMNFNLKNLATLTVSIYDKWNQDWTNTLVFVSFVNINTPLLTYITFVYDSHQFLSSFILSSFYQMWFPRSLGLFNTFINNLNDGLESMLSQTLLCFGDSEDAMNVFLCSFHYYGICGLIGKPFSCAQLCWYTMLCSCVSLLSLYGLCYTVYIYLYDFEHNLPKEMRKARLRKKEVKLLSIPCYCVLGESKLLLPVTNRRGTGRMGMQVIICS